MYKERVWESEPTFRRKMAEKVWLESAFLLGECRSVIMPSFQ